MEPYQHENKVETAVTVDMSISYRPLPPQKAIFCLPVGPFPIVGTTFLRLFDDHQSTNPNCIQNWYKRDATRSTVVILVTIFQNELMIEICSKSLVRAIG